MIDQSHGATDLIVSTQWSAGIIGVLEACLPNGWRGGAWKGKAGPLSMGALLG